MGVPPNNHFVGLYWWLAVHGGLDHPGERGNHLEYSAECGTDGEECINVFLHADTQYQTKSPSVRGNTERIVGEYEIPQGFRQSRRARNAPGRRWGK